MSMPRPQTSLLHTKKETAGEPEESAKSLEEEGRLALHQLLRNLLLLFSCQVTFSHL